MYNYTKLDVAIQDYYDNLGEGLEEDIEGHTRTSAAANATEH